MASKDAKTGDYSWRKKPRKWAPKSRLGCKTCKIRKIKCDLTQPSCNKCCSTGRKCDGYSDQRLPCTTIKNELSISPPSTPQSCMSITHCDILLPDLGPLMILPTTGPAHADAMGFFEHTSLKHLNAYQPSISWQNTLMYFSQTVPAVRHAAMALSLVHRRYTDNGSPDLVHRPQLFNDWLPSRPALHHYNRAIELLLSYKKGDDLETQAITLLVCYLFHCFDQLSCNYVQAIKHLRGGIEVLRNINESVTAGRCEGAQLCGYRPMVDELTTQIGRLDSQAVMFLVDWYPSVIKNNLSSALSGSDDAFQRLQPAADGIQEIVSEVMGLRNAEQLCELAESRQSVQAVISKKLDRWSMLFENLLQRRGHYMTRPEDAARISLLRLHYITSRILLDTSGYGREMNYDAFLPQFEQCLTLADEASFLNEQPSQLSKAIFTPQIGIIPPLYIVGVKCRHPMARRKAINILRRHRVREAVWDTVSSARVIEEVIKIEEGESERSLGDIPSEQRVEVVSWGHEPSGQWAGRLNLQYTLCGQEEFNHVALDI